MKLRAFFCFQKLRVNHSTPSITQVQNNVLAEKMKSATMSTNVLKRENASASANVLMCKQWWKVCWMYGDQEKYYRQLYAKRAANFKTDLDSDRAVQQQQQHSLWEQDECRIENAQGKRFPNKQVNGSSTPDVTNATSTVLGSLDLTSGIDE